jgi:hypothetical protein
MFGEPIEVAEFATAGSTPLSATTASRTERTPCA